MMRYTLRLLTAQQFQRAAALICAAEVLRRADPGTWGDRRFSIGLWVVKTLLARRGSVVHFLLRPESEGKVAALLDYWGVAKTRAIPVYGDLTGKKMGVARIMKARSSIKDPPIR